MSKIAKYCKNMKNVAELLHFNQGHEWNQDLNSWTSEQKTNTLPLRHAYKVRKLDFAFIEPQPAYEYVVQAYCTYFE